MGNHDNYLSRAASPRLREHQNEGLVFSLRSAAHVMDIEGPAQDKTVTTATVVRHKGAGAKGKKRENVQVI
jgi:hypothetical protein